MATGERDVAAHDQEDQARPQGRAPRQEEEAAAIARSAARRRFIRGGAMAPVILTLGHGTSLAAQQFMGASVCLSLGGMPQNQSGNANTTKYICN